MHGFSDIDALLPRDEQMQRWVAELDAFGNHPTGTPEHHAYNDRFAQRLREAGVEDVQQEAWPMPHFWHVRGHDPSDPAGGAAERARARAAATVRE